MCYCGNSSLEYDYKISIIIPYYNVSSFLIDRCLNSCYRTSFESLEVILVNDGSSKQFVDELKKLKKKYPQLIVINQENQGVSAARNRGILAAKGEYIAFVDADDLISEGFLSESYQIAKENACDLVMGYVQFFLNDIEPLQNVQHVETYYQDIEIAKIKPLMVALQDFDNLYKGYLGRGPVAKLIKTEFAQQVAFKTNLQIGEDVIWNLDILNHCNKVCITDRVWYYYYNNSVSASHKYDENIISKLEIQQEELFKRIDYNNDNEYMAYAQHVKENIRIVWNNLLSKEYLPTEKVKRYKHHLFTDDHWNIFREKRFFRLASAKEKLYGVLYTTHLLFMVFSIRQAVL